MKCLCSVLFRNVSYAIKFFAGGVQGGGSKAYYYLYSPPLKLSGFNLLTGMLWLLTQDGLGSKQLDSLLVFFASVTGNLNFSVSLYSLFYFFPVGPYWTDLTVHRRSLFLRSLLPLSNMDKCVFEWLLKYNSEELKTESMACLKGLWMSKKANEEQNNRRAFLNCKAFIQSSQHSLKSFCLHMRYRFQNKNKWQVYLFYLFFKFI